MSNDNTPPLTGWWGRGAYNVRSLNGPNQKQKMTGNLMKSTFLVFEHWIANNNIKQTKIILVYLNYFYQYQFQTCMYICLKHHFPNISIKCCNDVNIKKFWNQNLIWKVSNTKCTFKYQCPHCVLNFQNVNEFYLLSKSKTQRSLFFIFI